MVFSQTSVPTRSILKVVDLNNLRPGKVNGTTETNTGGILESQTPQLLPVTNSNFSEVRSIAAVYLKPEPLFENTMFNESDCEFFQDLVQWCSDPAKEEPELIDSSKKREENSQTIDTLHTTSSPHGWDILDANSPTQVGFYTSTPNDSLSPNMEGFTTFDNNFQFNLDVEVKKKNKDLEPNLDILNLPVVIGELASEEMVDFNPCPAMEPVDYFTNTTQNTEYTSTFDTHKMFLTNVDDEDSLDMKLGSVILGEVENNNVVTINTDKKNKEVPLNALMEQRNGIGLSLNVTTPAPWSTGIISTPEVLSYVEQLEKEKCLPIAKKNVAEEWPLSDTGFVALDTCPISTSTPSADYQPMTPKSESHIESDVDDNKSHISRNKRRRNSEDSDETYTPHAEYTPRSYKRRKQNVPIKDMILALEESQQLPKARRGRPPKRRESTVSSVCSIDDNTSLGSTHEYKYRELRDKNNEASKRSRMNRKLKELQMEQLALELEERNKKLQVKADILADMTKRLKDALMTAILQK